LTAHNIRSIDEFTRIHNGKFPNQKIDSSNVRKMLLERENPNWRKESDSFSFAKRNLESNLYDQDAHEER